MKIDLSSDFTNHIIDGMEKLLPRIPIALFDLLLGILIIRIIERLVRLAMRFTNVQAGLRDVISSILAIILWLLLAITLLNELGFTGIIYFFTGSVAAIGIAMAAGGSTLVADIIAGIFLARDTDFNVGDEVIVGETPTLGVIESMDARRTRIRDENGILHVIPNSIVERKEWVLIRKGPDMSPLANAANAAKRLRAVAREGQAVVMRRRKPVSNNDQ